MKRTVTEALAWLMEAVNEECKRGRALTLAEDIEQEITGGDLCEDPDSPAANIAEAVMVLLTAAAEDFDFREGRG